MTDRRWLRRRLLVLFAISSLLAVGAILLWIAPSFGLEESLPWLKTAQPRRAHLLALAALLLPGGAMFLVWHLRQRNTRFQQRLAKEGITYLILPRIEGSPINPETLWTRLPGAIPPEEWIAFDLVARPHQLSLTLRALPATATRTTTHLFAAWPRAQVQALEPDSDPLLAAQGTNRAAWWCEVQAVSPMPSIQAQADPCGTLLAALTHLPAGVQGGVQILVRRDDHTARELVRAATRATEKPLSAREQGQRRDLAQRATHPFQEVRLLIWAAASDQAQARDSAHALTETVIRQYGSADPLRRVREGKGLPARAFRPFSGQPWADVELASLLHHPTPADLERAPYLQVAPAHHLAPDPANLLPPNAALALPELAQVTGQVPSTADHLPGQRTP